MDHKTEVEALNGSYGILKVMAEELRVIKFSITNVEKNTKKVDMSTLPNIKK